MANRPRVAIDYPQDWRPLEAESPTPLHVQMRERMRSAIDEGRLKPDQRVPNEAKMGEIFGVSRTVVRQAVQALVNEGLLRKRPSRGTFVTRRKAAVEPSPGLALDPAFHARAVEMRNEVISQTFRPLPQRPAEVFGTEPGDLAIEVARLRFVEQEPRVYVSSWLPFPQCDFLLSADLTQQSLFAALQAHGFVIARARRTVEAVAATPMVARMLKVKTGTPLLAVETVSYLEDGRPLEYSEALYRADRMRLEAELLPLLTHGPETPGQRAYINAITTAMEH